MSFTHAALLSTENDNTNHHQIDQANFLSYLYDIKRHKLEQPDSFFHVWSESEINVF